MTLIEFYEFNEKITGFLIEGHSNSNEYGKDIVCASISATSLMTLNGMIEVLGIDDLIYELKDGYIKCELKNEEYIKRSQDLLKSLKLILKQISQDYPKNVKFRIRRYGK